MNLSDFSFTLPENSIAQIPAHPRDHAKLLVIDRAQHTVAHHHFYDLPTLLPEHTFLVRNNSQVIKSRLRGIYDSGSSWELFFIKGQDNTTGEFLVRPGKKFHLGKEVSLSVQNVKITVTVQDICDNGARILNISSPYASLYELLEKHGELPLPPYITERSGEEQTNYQTVYAAQKGSLAAPTAGLHFTEETFKELAVRNIPIEDITLHVGLGTFLPVKTENITDHVMHGEDYSISPETWERIQNYKQHGYKLCSVGTTTTRVLEHVFGAQEPNTLLSGSTSIFIYPSYTWKAVDILLTNFHLPKSTLLMLVSSFIGDRTWTLEIYEEAIAKGYRFYSYGDAMLIL